MIKITKPTVFLSNLENHFLTFYWEGLPNAYVGYRLIEGDPFTVLTPISEPRNLSSPAISNPRGLDNCVPNGLRPPYPEWLSSYQESDPSDPYQFAFRTCEDGSAHCSAFLNQKTLTLTWDLVPDETGVWMTLKITSDVSIPAFFGLQQCLRYTGSYNEYWRRIVAQTAYLSELDLQAMGQPNRTLSFARKQDDWLAFPAAYTSLPTRLGQSLLSSTDVLDHGLIPRQTVDRKVSPGWYWEQVAPGSAWNCITSGMNWEQTLLVSNRHPADCLHAIINIGPLQTGETRIIHGKFYWIEGTMNDLLALWQKDFA